MATTRHVSCNLAPARQLLLWACLFLSPFSWAQPSAASPEKPDSSALRPPGEKERLAPRPVDEPSAAFVPGRGLSWTSRDGQFALAPRLRIQFRDELDIDQVPAPTSEGGTQTRIQNTFGIRRARLQFKGHVFGRHNEYKAEFAFSPRDLGYEDGVVTRTPLLTWFAQFTHLRDLSVRLGQYKLLYSRQRVISSGNLEFVDRTLAQGEFNLDRDVGFHLFSDDFLGLDRLKYYAGVTLGQGRDAWLAEDLTDGTGGFQYLARLELLPFGDFDDYSEVDFTRSRQLRASLGAAYAYSDEVDRTRGYQGDPFADDGRVDYANATVDMLLKWVGATVFTEFFWRDGTREQPVSPGDTANLPRDGFGGSLQVGYLVPRLPLGVGARYSGIGLGVYDAEESGLTARNELGATVGWYFAGHPLKLQADYFHIWEPDSAQSALDRVRVQLQLAY